jgi:hypothetical protein
MDWIVICRTRVLAGMRFAATFETSVCNAGERSNIARICEDLRPRIISMAGDLQTFESIVVLYPTESKSVLVVDPGTLELK